MDAFDAERGAMDLNHGHGVLKERLIERVDRVVVLADSSKLGIRSSYSFAETKRVNVLVTDEGASPALISSFETLGVKVIVAKFRTSAAGKKLQ